MRNVKLNPHKPHFHYSNGEWVCFMYRNYGFGETPRDAYNEMSVLGRFRFDNNETSHLNIQSEITRVVLKTKCFGIDS